VEALERAQQVTATWDERLRGDLPDDLDIFDAHTHLGTDIDGMVGRYEELLGALDRYGISRAFVFCLDEPDRHPAFRAANDRTLAYVGYRGAECFVVVGKRRNGPWDEVLTQPVFDPAGRVVAFGVRKGRELRWQTAPVVPK